MYFSRREWIHGRIIYLYGILKAKLYWYRSYCYIAFLNSLYPIVYILFNAFEFALMVDAIIQIRSSYVGFSWRFVPLGWIISIIKIDVEQSVLIYLSSFSNGPPHRRPGSGCRLESYTSPIRHVQMIRQFFN